MNIKNIIPSARQATKKNDIKNPLLLIKNKEFINNIWNFKNTYVLRSRVSNAINNYFSSINRHNIIIRKYFKKSRYWGWILRRLYSKYPQYIISDISYKINGNSLTLQFFYYAHNSIYKFNNKKFGQKNKSRIRFTNRKSASYQKIFKDPSSSLVNYYHKNNYVKNLIVILQKIYGCRVNIICNRLHYPYINANILAQYLWKNANRKNFIHIWKTIIRKPIFFDSRTRLSAFIVGIKIKIGGRLITQRVIPRKTSKSVVIGTFSPQIIKEYRDNNKVSIDMHKLNLKNRIGAFTITTKICSILRKNK